MKKMIAIFACAALSACATPSLSASAIAPHHTEAAAETPTETPVVFEAGSGETVQAYEGSFTVPENRSDPESRRLTLRYVRFPATGDANGPPLVYLAGGPGGSGIRTAKGRRYPLFMAMRTHGDVIAFDQRGTGASDDLPRCISSIVQDDAVNTADSEYIQMHQDALAECLTFWKDKGVDVRGYATPESVADLDALRIALGADKISLWGISYGSHLALAALKSMDDRIDRVIIASAEGLDQTIKLPARTDQYFARLQEAINTQPAAQEMFPDIAGMMRYVHAKLEAEPILLQIPQRDGSTRPFLLKRRDMQRIASAMIADPQNAARLVHLYGAVAAGITEPVAGLIARFGNANEPISYSLMSTLMDVASGTGEERRTQIEQQAETSLLATFLNQPAELEDVEPSLVLGDDFRMRPTSDVPLLLLSGTLDGRTYIESQREAVSGLPNAKIITVVNAGHNLFMSSPEVMAAMDRFMRGEAPLADEIVIELPDFAALPQR